MKVVFPYPQPYGIFPDIYEYVEALRRLGIDARYVGWEPKGSRWQFLQEVASEIAKITPDLVHVFHFRGSGLLPLLVRDKQIKWIIDVRTVHVQNRRLKTDSFFWLKDKITWLESQMYDHICVITSYLKSKLQPSLRPISVVPLGGSWERFNSRERDSIRSQVRRDLNIPQDAIVLLYSGSLSPTRRVDVIIEAFARTCRLWPMDNVRLIVVGGIRGNAEISDKIIDELQKIARAAEVVGKVVFTGERPYEEACKFYLAADIGISYLPSQSAYAYQPPTKIIEYMMAGLLVVSNRTPGVEEIVEGAESAILCGNGADELTRAIVRALEVKRDEALAKRLVEDARERVRWRDWGSIVKNYVIPIYEQLA